MSLAFLIDGYNLIHALGLVHKKIIAKELETARRRLLEFLHERLEPLSGDITVVFDAKRRQRHVPSEYQDGRIQVCFAGRNLEADDVIEELLAKNTSPRRLVVVSEDRRLRDAAARRRARCWGAAELLDHMEGSAELAAPPTPAVAEQPRLSPKEVQQWLREFDGVELPNEYRDFLDPPATSE